MRVGLIVLTIIAVLGTGVQAAQISISMVRDQWPGGQPVEFALFAVGGDMDPSADAFPDHVVCTLENGSRTHTVIAREVERPESIETGDGAGTRQARYAFDPPAAVHGLVRMRVPEFQVPVILFTVGPPERPTLIDETYPTLDSLFSLYQPYLGNIGAYKPMYFLVGTEPEKSKFQFSFSYRFFNPESDLAGHHPWVRGFHLGYTQTSFWDLKSSSAPFEDTSYKPELFWLSKNYLASGKYLKGLFLQPGAQHESNGRGGDDSRSTNYLYLQPILIFYRESSRYGLQVAPKIWTYVNNDNDTNPDLDRYRGYFDLEIKLGKLDGFVLGSSFRWAAEGASIQLDLTYPLHRFLFKTLDIYLQAQYVDALAESLIDYKDRSRAFRLGFSIVR